MSDLIRINREILTPGLALLPSKFDSPAARVLLLAIGLQESRLTHRRQIGGPARGLWQFERGGGVHGVLSHPASKSLAHQVCRDCGVEPTSIAVYTALESDDKLATAFARLLLWTDPKALPAVTDIEGGWGYYIRNWRPGKPHRHTWDALHKRAQGAIR